MGGDGIRTAWVSFVLILSKPMTSSRTRVQNVTLDDASPLVTYSGFTTVSPPSSYRSDSSIPLDPSVDSNGSLSSTSTPGASASVSFLGDSLIPPHSPSEAEGVAQALPYSSTASQIPPSAPSSRPSMARQMQHSTHQTTSLHIPPSYSSRPTSRPIRRII